MPNYSNGKIYTIRCKVDDSLIYVGATTQKLSVRFTEHKIKKDTSINRYVREHFENDWNYFYIELFELFPCNSKEELNKREGEVIREKGNINKCIVGRTLKEWRIDNEEKLCHYNKEYYENNKTKIQEYQKKYREQNTEKRKEYQKQYREQNIDILKEKDKQKYKNKKQLKEDQET